MPFGALEKDKVWWTPLVSLIRGSVQWHFFAVVDMEI